MWWWWWRTEWCSLRLLDVPIEPEKYCRGKSKTCLVVAHAQTVTIHPSVHFLSILCTRRLMKTPYSDHLAPYGGVPLQPATDPTWPFMELKAGYIFNRIWLWTPELNNIHTYIMCFLAIIHIKALLGQLERLCYYSNMKQNSILKNRKHNHPNLHGIIGDMFLFFCYLFFIFLYFDGVGVVTRQWAGLTFHKHVAP